MVFFEASEHHETGDNVYMRLLVLVVRIEEHGVSIVSGPSSLPTASENHNDDHEFLDVSNTKVALSLGSPTRHATVFQRHELGSQSSLNARRI